MSRSGTLVLRRPGTLVMVGLATPAIARQVDSLVREQGPGPLSPLQAGALVRKVANVAPIYCACGCGRLVEGSELASVLEQGAVLS